MIVKNLTPKIQKIELKEMTEDKRVFEMYVQPHATAVFERLTLSGKESYEGIFEIDGVAQAAPAPVVINEVQEEEVEEIEPEVNEEKFICDVCGAEFASARGLASHKNRAHSE